MTPRDRMEQRLWGIYLLTVIAIAVVAFIAYQLDIRGLL